MCGIAGVLHTAPVALKIAETSTLVSKMKHRGPDGDFVLHLPHISLGHARLSITDLTTNGQQPFTTNNGRYTIVFNGAIYNYKLLRKQLEGEGFVFKTGTDTEVFVNMFTLYGARAFNMLEGMFAAGIWDAVEQRLTLVRDRFGEKPLYYRKLNSMFCFASECDALAAIGNNPGINLAAINHLLAIGYILNPLSVYNDVFCIPPATYVEITNAGQNIQQHSYWNYISVFESKISLDARTIKEQFLTILKQAVKSCIDCEVPYGFFLSGGIDSATILGLAANCNATDLKSYTVYFEHEKYSEFKGARYTAEYFNAAHKSILFSDEDIRANAGAIINTMGSPITDNSFISTYKVAAEAAKECKVVITGDGADELMAGYVTYKADRLYPFFNLMPAFVKQALATHSIFGDMDKALNARFLQRQFFSAISADYKKAHYSWRLLHAPAQREKIMGQQHRDLIHDTDPYLKFDKIFNDTAHLDKYDRFLVVDALTWLTDNILVKSDRAAMANGLETRAPFLNYKLVAFLGSLNFEWKLKATTDKYILRQAMKGILSDKILQTAKKGFNTPPAIKMPGVNQFTAYNEWFIKNYRQGILNNCYTWQ